MTLSGVATCDGNACLAAYEQLRCHVLVGASTTADPVGWAVLVREGIVAWMAHSSAGSAPIGPAVDRDRLGATAQLPDEVHAAVVRVLASMALAGRGEVSP